MFRPSALAIAALVLFSSATAAAQKSSPAMRAPAKAVAAPAGPKAGKPGAKVAAKKPKKLSRYAAVELYEINTKETLMLRFYDDKGRPIKGWQKRFDRFMRCHQTGAVFRMDGRLAQMLYKTARYFEGHRMEVVSGYRHPKVARNPKSPHKLGLACDFRMAGVANTALRDYLRKSYEHVGVGYYPNSVFVHLDNRKTGPSAFWIDYSGPGEAAEYSENASDDLRTGRAEKRRPHDSDSEGQDDMAQAGLAAPAVSTRPGRAAGGSPPAGRPPVEIKASSDPFGD